MDTPNLLVNNAGILLEIFEHRIYSVLIEQAFDQLRVSFLPIFQKDALNFGREILVS